MNLDNIKITPILDSIKLLNISDEEYFGNGYKDYISNSRLKLINPEQDGSPQDYFEGLSKHNIYSDSLLLGSAVHGIILQPESFRIIDGVDRPTAKCGYIADLVYHKDGTFPTDDELIEAATKIDYYKGNLSETKITKLCDSIALYLRDRATFESTYNFDKTPIYLDAKLRAKSYRCIEAIENNKSIQKLLHPKGVLEDPKSFNENVILVDVKVEVDDKEPIILKLKSKLDNFTLDLESNVATVNDLKTSGSMLNVFNESFEKYHYYREMGMYCWMLSNYVNKEYGLDSITLKSNCLVVSTIPNFYTKVYTVSKKELMKGLNEFRYLLKLVAYYTVYGY